MVVDKLADAIGLDGYLEHVLELRVGREQDVGLKVDDVLLVVGAESEILVDLSVHYICLQITRIFIIIVVLPKIYKCTLIIPSYLDH